MRKTFFYIGLVVFFIVIALIIFLNFFYSGKNYKYPINFLNKYAVVKESSFMETPQNEPFYYFQKGWLKRGKKYLMILPKSSIRFFSIEKKKRTIYIELSKGNLFNELKTITIELLLNGIHFKNLEISTRNNSFLLPAPKKFIKKGNNILELIVNKKNLDKQKQPGYLYLNKFSIKKYKRTKNFLFKNSDNRSEIIQPSQSLFEYYVVPKRKETFHYSFKARKIFSADKIIGKVLVKLKIKNKKEITIAEFVLSNNSKNKYYGKFKLDAYSGKIVRLSFILLSSKTYLTVKWENLFIEKENINNVVNKSIKMMEKKPHIFLILIDAARYDRFGFSGFNKKVTPIINRFAKKSYNFISFFAQAPYTTASVATMLSGLYPETHTVRYKDDELPENVSTISQYLNKNGYITNAISGSIALTKNNLIKDFKKTLNIRSKKKWRGSAMQIEKLKKFIGGSDFSKPNFFYIHLLPPHEPYIPPAPFNENFTKTSLNKMRKRIGIRDKANLYLNIDKEYLSYIHKCYLNNLSYADYLVGEIIGKLKDNDIFNDSIIIISSDHGEAFFEHSKLGHNTTNYNEMIQIPFLLKMPRQKKGVQIKKNHGLIDLTPTILELLNINFKIKMQGRSFAPILFQEKFKFNKRFLYSRTASKNFNLALIYGDYKYIYYSGRGELYNLKDDPDELNDISKENQLLAGLLRQEAFIKIFESNRIKKQYNIKGKQVKDKNRYLEELKSLGYL